VRRLQDAVEAYLTGLRLIRGTGGGTSETSYYAPLERLLNTIGGNLKPKVFCVSQLADQGAGHPNFGLFTATQCQKGTPKKGQIPERGVIEVKGSKDDTWLTAGTEQISKYWEKYRLVLVTNYRDFLLIGEDGKGRPANLESYRLANSEREFWSRLETPRKYTWEVGGSFGEYLRRTMTQTVTLRDPKDLAWFLAFYARDALSRVEDKGEIAALQTVRDALEETLGITFQGKKGDHFFRSTLVQTLFYGLFSAWVLWARQKPPPTTPFDWKTASWHLRVPMLQALFQQVSDPSKLHALGLVEVLDWAAMALNRVQRTEFFARFSDTEAVQYFYEPFLEAFDPTLRKQLGVWYTPSEVVRYMVARVDKALKDDLGIADGLAAENVYVLDPCMGTGSFLAEVLRRIAANLEEKGLGALKGPTVRKAATTRVFGFEIMPAPFVVAHLQVSLVLNELNAPLAEDGGERAGIFLTNALTGWEPTDKDKQHVAFPEMEEERDRANAVKRDKPILVILGNPPYNGYAGIMDIEEERALSDAYRTVHGTLRQPEGQDLNDLYIRFFRMAERRIAEKTGQGIVCFISNYSWLDGLSFPGMRQRYLDVFDAIRIDVLNGDKYKTGKTTPDGAPDPSIFSTEHNKAGIQVGTAVATLIRKPDHAPATSVQFRNLWGREKRRELLDSAEAAPEALYQPIEPVPELGLPYVEARVGDTYFKWPALPDLLPTSFPGVKTSRDEFLVDIDLDRLKSRVTDYFDPNIEAEEFARKFPSIMQNSARFDGPDVRRTLSNRGLLGENFVRYAYRPFDVRWLYWEPETSLLDRNRTAYWPHVFDGNIWIEAREKETSEIFSRGYLTSALADNFGNGLSHFFPMYLHDDHARGTGHPVPLRPNVTRSVSRILESKRIGIDSLFSHIAAIIHAPYYRTENSGGLRMGWPRIPICNTGEMITASAKLGGEISTLIDPEKPAANVTADGLRAEMKVLGVPTKTDQGEITGEDFALNAGWGRKQAGGIVMPGKGLIQAREYRPQEIQAFAAGAGQLGLPPSEIYRLLGETSFDIHLNDDVYWSNVPANVWNYRLGGYQVIKKWLSYREREVLGRPLRLEEVQEVSNMIRRIAAILLLTPALNANYELAKENADGGTQH